MTKFITNDAIEITLTDACRFVIRKKLYVEIIGGKYLLRISEHMQPDRHLVFDDNKSLQKVLLENMGI